MSKKANPAMIGAFLIGAVILAVLALFLFGSQQYFTKKQEFIMYFEDSVNGLDVGAPVKFKGVPVGQVKSILIRFNQFKNSTHIPVVIEIDNQELAKSIKLDKPIEANGMYDFSIEKGLKGKLVLQSYLTGKLFVELDFYPDVGPPKFIQVKPIYKEIPTVESDLEAIWDTATHVLEQFRQVDIEEIGNRIESIATNLDEGLKDIDFRGVSDSLIAASDSVTEVFSDFDPENVDFRKIFSGANGALEKISVGVGSLEAMLRPASTFRYELEGTLQEVKGAASSIKLLTDLLERNPKVLLTGKKIESRRKK